MKFKAMQRGCVARQATVPRALQRLDPARLDDRDLYSLTLEDDLVLSQVIDLTTNFPRAELARMRLLSSFGISCRGRDRLPPQSGPKSFCPRAVTVPVAVSVAACGKCGNCGKYSVHPAFRTFRTSRTSRNAIYE
jgi:hypothetical protein